MGRRGGGGGRSFPQSLRTSRILRAPLSGLYSPHAARGREVAGYIADKPRRHVKAGTHRRGHPVYILTFF